MSVNEDNGADGLQDDPRSGEILAEITRPKPVAKTHYWCQIQRWY